LPINNFKGSFAAYYSETGLRGWGGTDVIFLGTLKLWGLTSDFQYKDKKSTIGISHSHTKQIKFSSYDNTKKQGVSFSDYSVNGLKSTGNDLFNWANDITKLYATVEVIKGLNIHADAQIYWKWQGMLDAMLAYDNKYAATSTADAVTWAAEKQSLKDKGYGKTDVRINPSISYKLPVKFSAQFTVFVMNMLETKRYVYNSGEDQKFPTRMYLYKEPRLIGMKLDVEL